MNIRELANLLGLSKSTVANALQDRGTVKAETAQRVKEMAKKLGYSPNPLAAAFYKQVRSKQVHRTRGNIAVLFPESLKMRKSLLRGIRQRSEELGFAIDPINVREYDPARLNQILVARGVLGVVVMPLDHPIEEVRLDWSNFAVVASGYSMPVPAVHRIVHNHTHGMRQAFQKFREAGCKRIGFAVTIDGNARSNGLWLYNYQGLQQELPAAQRVAPLVASNLNFTVENIRAWIRKEKPDGIIFHFHVRPYPGVITSERVLSFQLSDVMKGFDKIKAGVLDRVPNDGYPGIDQQYPQLGRQMVDLLSQQILHNERGIPACPAITMVDGKWTGSFQ